MWLKINDTWGEYEWRCADTNTPIVKSGITIHGKGKNLFYKDSEGVCHFIVLKHIDNGQIIDPVTNKPVSK